MFQNLRKHFSYLAVGWTLLIVVSLVWNNYQNSGETKEKALIEARTIFEHNIAYNKWNVMNGGVYAPATGKNGPDPYITAPDRDITSMNGRKLTMITHFRMTRQAYEFLRQDSPLPTLNRTISMKPLNPENAPDEWEKKALIAFEKGRPEVSEITTINGQPYLRMLKPYVTAIAECLGCHGVQGYRVGDIRGGLSIAVPMKPYYEGEARTRTTTAITHLLLWLVGMAGIFVLSKDIQKKQREIAESEWKFRTLSEFAYDWEYWVLEDARIVFMSPSCERVTGYTQEEFVKNPALLSEIIYPEDAPVFGAHLPDFRAPQHDEIEFRITTKEGKVKWLSHVCAPIHDGEEFLGRRISNRDITDRKGLEDQLAQSQKMESLGLLAGGTAHDFNNLLTAITGYSSLLREELKDGGENVRRYIQHVIDASEKAQNLTHSLLTFSRKQIIKPGTVSLNLIIENLSGLLDSLIGEDIELRMRLTDREFPVFADSHQIEQVLMNLITNARDAMPSGGKLSVETVPLTLPLEYTSKYNAKPGNYMMLSISDTGVGIDKKDLASIFEPFFTTKGKDRGTGLGLSIVYGIIKQHDGFINVYSEKGLGTTFRIYIPASEKEGAARHDTAVSREPLAGRGGSETILVAEDEESVREFLNDILMSYGYKIILAVDGEDAVSKYNAYKDRLDMVILDVIMPRKNGRDVYNAIKETSPDAKVLFISGYTQDILTSKGIYEDGLDFVAKPLEVGQLMAKIREILGKNKR